MLSKQDQINILRRFVASCPEGSCLASMFNDVLVSHIEDKIRENIGEIDYKELSCIAPELNNLDSLDDLNERCSNCHTHLTEWDTGCCGLCFECACKLNNTQEFSSHYYE